MKELDVHPAAKGLIFDLDGTLIDSMPLHYEAWRDVCATKGVDFTEKEFYALAGVHSERIFEIINEKYGTDFDPVQYGLIKEEVYMKKLQFLKPVEPVLELVKKYHGRLPMSIGTGSPGKHSWEAVKALGLDKYFEIMVSKDDVTRGKPDPETFLKCAAAMKVEPKYCQVFEDGKPGLEAAKRAGMMVTDIRSFL